MTTPQQSPTRDRARQKLTTLLRISPDQIEHLIDDLITSQLTVYELAHRAGINPEIVRALTTCLAEDDLVRVANIWTSSPHDAPTWALRVVPLPPRGQR
jgi:hypothetical protein